MSEKMQKAFEENRARAAEADRVAQEAEAEKKAAAEASWREYNRKRHHKACIALAIRVLIACAVMVGLWAATAADLIVDALARPLASATLIWLAVWAGAWVQFMFCKRGLLE